MRLAESGIDVGLGMEDISIIPTLRSRPFGIGGTGGAEDMLTGREDVLAFEFVRGPLVVEMARRTD